MTLKNLQLALQLNNAEYNKEINIIIDYINRFLSDNKYDLYLITQNINALDSKIDTVNGNLTYAINQHYTYFYNAVGNLREDFDAHQQNSVIHATKEDKELWNATLDNAKDYAKELFNKLTSFEIIKCTELPTEDIKTMTIYFLQIDPKDNDLYEEYMYIDGQWEKIGNTRIDLSDYVTKEMLQTEVDKLNNSLSTLQTNLEQTITDLSDKTEQSIDDVKQSIIDLSDNTQQSISDLSDETKNALSTLKDNLQKQLDDITINTGDSNVKLKQDIDAINKDLKDNYKPNVHNHDNKDILDKITKEHIPTDAEVEQAIQDILNELNKEDV